MPSPHRRRRRRSSRSEEHGRSSSQSRSHAHRSSNSSQVQPVDAATVWLLVAGIYWLLLLMAMHFPGSAIPEELRPSRGNDGAFHCGAYAVFALLICRAFDALHRRRYPTVNPPVLVYLFIFLACITYGYVDEETQPFTGRTSDSADWEADVLGSLLGVCGHLFLTVFFTGDPAQAVADRINHRRRHRRHRSHRHRSSRPAGGEHGSDGVAGSGDDESNDRSAEDDRSRGRRRRRRRRSAETRDDSSAGEATIDDSLAAERPPAVPQPEPPTQSEAEQPHDQRPSDTA